MGSGGADGTAVRGRGLRGFTWEPATARASPGMARNARVRYEDKLGVALIPRLGPVAVGDVV